MFNPNEQTNIHYWVFVVKVTQECPTDVLNSCTYTYKSNITNCISLYHHCASMTVLQI